MNHLALPRFWKHYRNLSEDIQALADRKFELLNSNPRHPPLIVKPSIHSEPDRENTR